MYELAAPDWLLKTPPGPPLPWNQSLPMGALLLVRTQPEPASVVMSSKPSLSSNAACALPIPPASIPKKLTVEISLLNLSIWPPPDHLQRAMAVGHATYA